MDGILKCFAIEEQRAEDGRLYNSVSMGALISNVIGKLYHYSEKYISQVYIDLYKTKYSLFLQLIKFIITFIDQFVLEIGIGWCCKYALIELVPRFDTFVVQRVGLIASHAIICKVSLQFLVVLTLWTLAKN